MVALYDGEISWTDELVGRLVDGLPADTALVVAADHGESLVEHDYILNHGGSLHEPSLRVPIIVVAPGVAPGSRVDAPTSVRHVAATLRALAGVSSTDRSLLDPAPDAGAQATGLLPTEAPDVIRSFAPGQQARPNFGERPTRQVAYRVGPEKWIAGIDGRVQRFDLLDDPGELSDLSAEDARTEDVRDAATEWLTHLGEVEAAARADTSAATLEALEALGYL